MKKAIIFSAITACLIIIFFDPAVAGDLQGDTKGWKAGVARVVITPEEPIWMAGYASRTKPSEGTLVDLWAKALAIEDAKGKKVLLITSDLLGFPRKMSDRIRNQIGAKFGLTRAQIILSSTHTHSGPVLQDALYDIYPLDAKQIEIIEKYSAKLEKQIVALSGEAIRSMVPAQLYAQNGVTRFQVNRRNNPAATISTQWDLNGPNDYAVPVLKVMNEAGDIMAVAFGYACHATTLDINLFSGDYPGYAQLELEKMHPGITAMFFQGAGADQNPLPRRTIPLAQQYGRELAAAVERVLREEMHRLEPSISTAYSEIRLPFAKPPTEEELVKFEKEARDYQKRWAANQLKMIRNGEPRMTSYPYPVQIWKLGDQPVMAMGGEVVVQYAIELKKLFGEGIFVMSYVNDDMNYIPSVTILNEGGYEGDTAHRVYGLPARWTPEIESIILREFEKLAVKTGINKAIK